MNIFEAIFLALTVTIVHGGSLSNVTQIRGQDKTPTPSNNITKIYEIELFIQANWYNAFMSCQRSGARLATINSQEEQTYLDELIESRGVGNLPLWISGTDLAEEGRFSWFSSGNAMTYTNWSPGQPDNMNGHQHCVAANYAGRLKWDDTTCTALFYFVCERDF